MAKEFSKKKPFKKNPSKGKKKGPHKGSSDGRSFHEKTFGKPNPKKGFDPNKDLEHGEESYAVRKRKNLLDQDRKNSDDQQGSGTTRKSFGKNSFEKKSFGKKDGKKSFGKSEGRSNYRSSERGYKRNDDDRGESKKTFSNPFRKPATESEDDYSNNFSGFKKRGGSDGENKERPYKKPFEKSSFRKDGDKPFRKPVEKSGEGEYKKPFERSEGAEDRKTFKRPFKKAGSDFGKEDKGEGYKKTFDRSENTDDRKTFKRPFKKAGSDFRKEGNEEGYKKSFDKPERTGESKPYRSADGAKKPFKKFARKPVGSGYKKLSQQDESIADGLVRLNKYISNAGICSRREADELIRAGVVSVNGKVVTEMGYKVQPDDVINYGGETLRKEKLVYVLLNKPKDFITTLDDPGSRKTVFDLVRNACRERIYPVGRLDRNTTGVLLLTNDGDLTKKLTHPKHGIKKVYQVTLDKPLNRPDFDEIATNGVTLEDGHIKPDIISYAGDGGNKKEVGLEIHSGRNRIVRRLFEQLGYTVVKLDRVVFAGLTKKDLPRGNWRILSEKEVAFLKMLG